MIIKAQIVGIIGVISFLSLILTSCQSAPEEDIVVNKRDDVLESIIANGDNSKSDSENSLYAPIKYKDSYAGADDKVTIRIDIETAPETVNAPVIMVKPHEITVEETKTWVNVLFENNEAYEPYTVYTKDELEKQILEYKRLLSDRDALLQYYNYDIELYEYSISVFEDMLAACEKQYETAPEEYTPKKTDWTFHPASYYDNMTGVQDESLDETLSLRMTSKLNGHDAMLYSSNRAASDFQLHELWFFYKDEANMFLKDEKIGNLAMSSEEAQEKAINLVKSLGLEQWEFFSIQKDTMPADTLYQERISYNIEFIKNYEGTEVIPQEQLSTIKGENDYAARYYYEKLTVRITNGIITNVMLTSPMDVVEIESANAQVLSFEKIKDLLKNQLQSEYTFSKTLGMSEEEYELMTGEKDLKAEVSIQRAEFGLVRIKVRDNDKLFRYVPAWCFYGDTSVNGQTYKQSSIITAINAVDGTTINVELGY